MFIFPRPLAAVAAALAVALLVLVLDRLSSAAELSERPAVARMQQGAACAPPPPCGIVRAGS